jgi:glycosyltransferase involved in cell wall biosynthesis
MWAGRMVPLKRVDVLLRALAPLRLSPHIGVCSLVGDGPERRGLQRLASKLGLSEQRVRFLPSMSHQEVRRLMRESDIYVLPSSGYEGWGAVVGEAMSEGSVVVASEEAGASLELIVDGESGRTFRYGDVRQLTQILDGMSQDHGLRTRLRQRAWERMANLWSPEVAAERVITLAKALVNGERVPFAEGPCSPAVAANDVRNGTENG